MKIIQLLTMAALVIMLTGCKEEGVKVVNGFKVIEVDSCEYLFRISGYQGYHLAHKGNCKFCKIRREQEYKAVMDKVMNMQE